MSKYGQPTVNDGFSLLAKSTRLSLGEYTEITQSQADIELFLKQHLDTFSTVLFGAFSRKTIVTPLAGSIIDMLVLYRESEIKHRHPSWIFQKLSNELLKQYPGSSILENRNVIMIPVKGFYFKIQPAYSVSDNSYMIPAEKFNDWVAYDINSYNEIFIRENTRHKGMLIEIIRMIKTWNRVSGNLFNGFYLELLVTEVLLEYEIKNYAETLCHIFRAALTVVVFQKHDPANMEFQIEGLNNIEDLITAMLLLKKSHKLAQNALTYEEKNDTRKTFDNLNKLFPNAFPSEVDMLVGKARSDGIRGADALKMMIKNKQ